MVRVRRIRRGYDAVSASAEDEADNQVREEHETLAAGEDTEGGDDVERQGRRRQYDSVSNTEEEEEEEGTKVTIVILDPAQKKFFVTAYTHWTIAKLKEKGEQVHKVPPPSQRLIYRGGLLQDNKTLEESKLTTDKLIVHLFPKPRVVIQQNNSCTAAADEENQEDAGAHIPQIVLNQDEAEQRAHILVLGSADFLEAQNNVKLFSFLLLVISSIEVFNLLLILMGVPPDDNSANSGFNTEDDYFNHDINSTLFNNNNNNNPYDNPYGNGMQEDPYQQQAIQQELQTWHPRNNIDLVISSVGVYVALLGIRATNETTLRLAQQYLFGTFVVGVAWMMYNYWFTVHVDEEFDELRREERHNRTSNDTEPVPIYDDDAIPYKTEWEYYQQNLSLMMIPGMVWILCCVRAWQFQSLLEEAEREAEERIRNELAQHTTTTTAEDGAVQGGDSADDDGATDEDGGSDIELQDTSRSSATPTAMT